MLEDRIIICFASNWFYDPTSKHHVMRLLSKRNHVVWVNYHASRRPRISGADAGAVAAKLRQFITGPRRVSDSLTVITPLVVPMPGNRAAAAVNRQLLTRQIKSVLSDLPDRPVQLWSFAPDVDYMCGRFDEECVVYYCVDEFSRFSGYDADATLEAEARLAARADLVVTTSRALYEAKRHLNPNVVMVPHGVDVEHFARARLPDLAVPSDIANLERPIMGFWGLLQDWLDVELIANVACRRQHWTIVLIGEVATDVSPLRNLPNVQLLGRREYRDLPAYAKGFDIGLIPFKVNELTRAVNPIKLREYLSAGLPVVSTALPEVASYTPLAAISHNPTEFIQACEAALATSDDCATSVPSPAPKGTAYPAPAERQAAMQRETWESKIEEICGYLSVSVPH
ncbi:MAG: glycosyltransferase [Planctomycetota bacterium]